jgi:hypothetical protein
VTTPVLLSFGVTGNVADDTSFSVFQLANGPAGTVNVCGNFFLGLQASIAVRLPMIVGPHRGARLETVLTQSSVAMVATSTWAAGGSININCMVDTGPRGASDSVPNGDTAPASDQLDARLAFKPQDGFGPSWRRDYSGQFDMLLEDTVSTPFLDTGVATGGSFGIRTVVGAREEFSNRFVVPGGPSWSVARVLLRLRRFGAPTGSMEVAIQAEQSDGYGHLEPDGVDIAVTAAVLNSVPPLSPGIAQVTFAFTPDAVLPPGNYFLVFRPSGAPYPVSLVNFIVWGQRRLFVANAGSHRTSLGYFFDQALYPGHVDVHFDTLAKEVGSSIVWAIPAAVAGNLMVSPDLGPLAEEVIRNAGHETIHALIFTFRTVGQTLAFRFAGHGHGVYSPPSWATRFVRRNVGRGLQ